MAFVLSSAYNVASLSCLQCGEIEQSSTSDCWFSNTKLMPFFPGVQITFNWIVVTLARRKVVGTIQKTATPCWSNVRMLCTYIDCVLVKTDCYKAGCYLLYETIIFMLDLREIRIESNNSTPTIRCYD